MPTIKQEKAVKALSENIGKPIGQAMRESGYSESTSKTPKRLTESDGWKELMDKNIPDKSLAKVHKEGLKANKDGVPDHAIRHKYLETGYKIKGKLKDAIPEQPKELHLHLHDTKKIINIVIKAEEEIKEQLLEENDK